MSLDKYTLLIAEDHDITRLGLRLTLEKMSDVEVVGEAIDGDSVLVRLALKDEVGLDQETRFA